MRLAAAGTAIFARLNRRRKRPHHAHKGERLSRRGAASGCAGGSARRFASGRRTATPGGETVFDQTEDCAAIFGNGLQPGEASHLGEIDPAKAHSGDEDIDAIAQWFMRVGIYGLFK